MNEIDLTSFWKGMDDAADLLIDTMGRSNVMDRISFGTFCCMIMEEFCRANCDRVFPVDSRQHQDLE